MAVIHASLMGIAEPALPLLKHLVRHDGEYLVGGIVYQEWVSLILTGLSDFAGQSVRVPAQFHIQPVL